MLGPINLLRGYCEVEVRGTYPERFLNLCARSGLEFWKTRRLEDGYLLRMRRSGVGMAEDLAGRCMCAVRVTGRHGAPFAAAKLLHRWAFLAGAVGFVLSLLFLGGRVWSFEVIGCEQVSPALVLRELGALGVGPGVKAKKIDPDLLGDEMLLRIPELRWLTVNVSGGIARVELRERTPPPESDAEGGPRNLVAARDGIVETVTALEGEPVVKPGDGVRAGDLLISGLVDNSLGARAVRAAGSVTALTRRRLTAAIPLVWDLRTDPGAEPIRTRTRCALIFGRRRINLHFSGSNLYPMCDKIILRKSLTLPDGTALPLAFEQATLLEYGSERRELPEAAARAALEGALRRAEAAFLGDRRAESCSLTFWREGDLCRAALTLTSVEEIGTPAEFPAAAPGGESTGEFTDVGKAFP